jgi:hypothetical protein
LVTVPAENDLQHLPQARFIIDNQQRTHERCGLLGNVITAGDSRR